jgi:SRSO17 transposase
MVGGLLMELDDHNCWTLAEAVGHRGLHRLQPLLLRAVWDDQHLMDIASAWAAGHLDDGDAVLIVDETADEKSSADCAGAARQYSGTLGGVALCQVTVTLTYATSRGHALIGRALYLPEGCAADEEHRELADVPEEVLFATKPQLAAALPEHAQSLGIDAAFVAGDEVYGGRELRRSIRERGMSYVLAVRANHTVTTGSGRTATAARAAGLISGRAWHRMRTGSGTKGTRHYDWAMLDVASDDTPGGHVGGHSVLLARRHRYTGTLSYYRCWTPGPAPLPRLIAVASARWRIEEDHQLGKQVARLDAGQVIRWTSWHRWTAVCLLAYVYLAVALQRQNDAGSDLGAGLIPAPSRNCCGSCATPSSRRSGETGPTGCTGQPGGAATSTAPATPTSAGTPTPRQHHHHSEVSSAVRGEAPKLASPAVPHGGRQGARPSSPSQMGQLHQTWHPVAAVQVAASTAGDAQPVEGIDHGDRPRDGAVLVFGEDAHRLFADLVGHVLGLGEQGHRVGERQRGAFLLRIRVCLPPGGEQVDPPFGLAELTGVAAVHVQAKRASVEHRAADLGQLKQPLADPASAALAASSALPGPPPGLHRSGYST